MSDKHDARAWTWLKSRKLLPPSRDLVASLAEQFREIEREARQDMVPLSIDGYSVFIEGQGEVELADEPKLREVVSAGDALRSYVTADFVGTPPIVEAWDAATKGIKR